MSTPSSIAVASARTPTLSAVVELLKPITWFAPMWAFGCGVISSGAPLGERWPLALAGCVLAGPLVCGMSQAVNDWYDRHVDAVNEPMRPIPSGRVPGRWGLVIAIGWTALSILAAWALGVWVLGAACLGVALAWAYSAPPLRLKRSGVLGPATVGAAYEGLPWFTGAAVMLGAAPGGPVLALAALYSLGAFGIMTLNDFKAIEGDRRTGVRSLPATIGVAPAARIACVAMAAPQTVVVALLMLWDRPVHAVTVALLLAAQLLLMRRLLRDPRRWAPWYNATGTTLYVLGMLASAFAVRAI